MCTATATTAIRTLVTAIHIQATPIPTRVTAMVIRTRVIKATAIRTAATPIPGTGTGATIGGTAIGIERVIATDPL